MPVTREEIKAFVARLMDEPAGDDYKERLGRKVWFLEHEIGESYGCERCRPGAIGLLRGIHDVVNIKLGKELYDPENFQNFIETVNDAAAHAKIPIVIRH